MKCELTSLTCHTLCYSGGTFGDLLVYYSTSMVDLLTLARDMTPSDVVAAADTLWFYDSPVDGHSSAPGNRLDRSSQPDPLQVRHIRHKVIISLLNAPLPSVLAGNRTLVVKPTPFQLSAL